MKPKNPGLTALLNALIPGLGFFYIDNLLLGFIALFLTVGGIVMFVIPGIVFWCLWIIIGYIQAADYNRKHFIQCSNCIQLVPRIAKLCSYCGSKILIPKPKKLSDEEKKHLAEISKKRKIERKKAVIATVTIIGIFCMVMLAGFGWNTVVKDYSGMRKIKNEIKYMLNRARYRKIKVDVQKEWGKVNFYFNLPVSDLDITEKPMGACAVITGLITVKTSKRAMLLGTLYFTDKRFKTKFARISTIDCRGIFKEFRKTGSIHELYMKEKELNKLIMPKIYFYK